MSRWRVRDQWADSGEAGCRCGQCSPSSMCAAVSLRWPFMSPWSRGFLTYSFMLHPSRMFGSVSYLSDVLWFYNIGFRTVIPGFET